MNKLSEDLDSKHPINARDESGFLPVAAWSPLPAGEGQGEGLVLHSIRTESNPIEPQKNSFMNPKPGQLGKQTVNSPYPSGGWHYPALSLRPSNVTASALRKSGTAIPLPSIAGSFKQFRIVSDSFMFNFLKAVNTFLALPWLALNYSFSTRGLKKLQIVSYSFG